MKLTGLVFLAFFLGVADIIFCLARVISISVNNRHPSTVQERQKTILIEFAAFVTIFDSQTINTDREAANLTVDAVLTLAVNVEKWLKVRD